MRTTLLAKTGATLLSVLALAGVTASSALAASNTATTWFGYTMCVNGTATQEPYVAGSYFAPVGATYADPYQGDCTTPLQLPQGYVATRDDVYKWTQQAGWAFCKTSDWVFGGYTAAHWSGDIYDPASYGAQARTSGGGCGPGYYEVEGAAYAYGYDSPYADPGAPQNWTSDWHGGWVSSGYEWLAG
jgi:hypothetical protein